MTAALGTARRCIRLAPVLALLTAAACSDSNPAGADNGSNNGGSSGNNTSITDCTTQTAVCFTALVDGQALVAPVANTLGVYVGNFLSVTGSDNVNYSLTFSLAISGTGCTGVPGTGANAASNAILTGLRGGATSWSSSPTQGSGSVTVTAITATTVAGRFSFTMPPTPNSAATGTKQVTAGTFNVRF